MTVEKRKYSGNEWLRSTKEKNKIYSYFNYVAPVNHVSWPAVHNGIKPFCSGKFSLVQFRFIEIIETICDKAFKRAFNSNGWGNS